jgi:hypothetical protein
MSNAAVQMLLKEAENLTRAEKVELIDSLTKQLESQPAKVEKNNLADFFQSSPLVGLDMIANMIKTTASRRGRIFPEIQWTPEQKSERAAERDAFYQRCQPIFDRVKTELIATHHNWFIAIEPDSEEYFIDRDLEVASLQCQEKHPGKLHYTFRLNKSGACGSI